MRILVTGGVGYIGSHTCHKLCENGYEVVIYDSLENGHKENVPKKAKLIVGNLSDIKTLESCFKEKIDGVIHFAGYIGAGESMTDPLRFFENNISNGLNLLKTMLKHNVKNIVFSSSAAVYGQPRKLPIVENTKKEPTNYYGLTKLMFEQILDSCKVYGINSIALRYFNAAGAGFGIGEDHNPETHLIPLILKAAIEDKEIKVFGTNYNTKDGSCVRDYIHVLDLAEAHIVALKSLDKGITGKFNVGTGVGASVFEVIKKCEDVTCKKIKIKCCKKRPGDPAELVADVSKINKELSWHAKLTLTDIIKSAWNWHKNKYK